MIVVFSYLMCFAAGILALPVIKWFLKRSTTTCRREDNFSESAPTSSLYGLEHGILNIEPIPKTWWMNMGYWSNDSQDFPSACRALLTQVLMAAGLVNSDGMMTKPLSGAGVKIVDLGFGCADQTLHLFAVANRSSGASYDRSYVPLRSYVGITISQRQFDFARGRLASVGLLPSDGEADGTPSASVSVDIRIFCADAANPGSWGNSLTEAVGCPFVASNTKQVQSALGAKDSATWILALDSLYHFYPSRMPIFRHAYTDMQASIMAFDLLLADNVNLLDRLLLAIVSFAMSAPFANFLTIAQYRQQLVDAGYSHDKIEVRDISEKVFGPLAAFMEQRDRDLAVLGKGLGAYKWAGRLFAWWARTKIVKGCIVVARRSHNG